MHSFFLPLRGEEVFVIVASPTGQESETGAVEFKVNLVLGKVLAVQRDVNPLRGFRVKVRLHDKNGKPVEYTVGTEAIVRKEYAQELLHGEIKALIAGGLVPIGSEPVLWSSAVRLEKVQVSPIEKSPLHNGGGSGPGPVKQDSTAGGSSKPWKRLLDKETPDISTVYDLREILGKGNYGTTRIAVHRGTKRRYACKSISKRKLSCQEDLDDVRREIEIMHHLGGHPNIIEFLGAYEDKHKIHLVMELCTGGELFDSIVERGHYSEKDAARVMRSMLAVVARCHNFGVIHRDLKPENFLLANRATSATLKAIDFGLSVYFKEDDSLKEMAGSAFYIAPEVLGKKYSKECDIWSCGVILYILLSGMPPFYGNTESQIFESVKAGPLDLSSEPWPRISDSAKDCIRKMLVRDRSKRATASEILQHEWIKVNGNASNVPLDDTVLDRIKGFAAMNRLKKEALMVIATNMPQDEIEGLRQMFKSMDTDEPFGTITVDELRIGLQKKGAKIPESELQKIMANVDVDGNGVIDYEEFLAMTLNLRNNEHHLLRAFEHFDKDGSGTISKDEIQQALGKYGVTVSENVDELLKEVDKDGDGEIDYEEFKEMMLSNK